MFSRLESLDHAARGLGLSRLGSSRASWRRCLGDVRLCGTQNLVSIRCHSPKITRCSISEQVLHTHTRHECMPTLMWRAMHRRHVHLRPGSWPYRAAGLAEARLASYDHSVLRLPGTTMIEAIVGNGSPAQHLAVPSECAQSRVVSTFKVVLYVPCTHACTSYRCIYTT